VILDETALSRVFLLSSGRLVIDLSPQDSHAVSAKPDPYAGSTKLDDFNAANDATINHQVNDLALSAGESQHGTPPFQKEEADFMAEDWTTSDVRPRKRNGVLATKASMQLSPRGRPPERGRPRRATAAATQGDVQRVITRSSEVVKRSQNSNALCTNDAVFRRFGLLAGKEVPDCATKSLREPRSALEARGSIGCHPSPEGDGTDPG
jgi:hypothetical protein